MLQSLQFLCISLVLTSTILVQQHFIRTATPDVSFKFFPRSTSLVQCLLWLGSARWVSPPRRCLLGFNDFAGSNSPWF
ncbi:hypothetical protein BDY21DRAFT_112983 [Lineolata rhizophorae]|uniref:Secreted protein n=1 Tax=Lineolata rhizophorae TaxID=578093 RepID=A0A6A6NQZ6_9PEZI|nr:hypothetical protein BDY21DRAFT_112983 [Lineolata rhizophorae]